MRWCGLVVALSGCYQPSHEQACTISCAAGSCPAGLTCGDDGLCFATVPCSQRDAATVDVSCVPSPTDLDGDCILDSMDACIAPAADALGNLDGDKLANGVDPCPWDIDRVSDPDTDLDGIPDICDPTTGADRVRCVMAFSDPALSAALWGTRGGDNAWTFATPNLAVGDGTSGTASMLARQSLEGAAMTAYDVVIKVNAGMGRIRLWVRATGTTSDLGCEIDTNGSPPTLGVVGATTTILGEPFSIDTTQPATFRARATLTSSSLDCRLTVVETGSHASATDGNETIPPGTFGITASGYTAAITGLVIYDRIP